jgi:Polyketide cyclase / dehydrase and lipid transport
MILTYTLISIAVVVLGFVVVVAVQPADFRITRTRTIAAAPSAVFPHVNDFHNWGAWSPWEKLDPQMKKTYDGSPAGVGAMTSWSGNNKVGEGRMTIEESRPSELVRIKLEFLRPFKATNTAEFTFKPEGNQTLMTWSMIGKRNFMMKGFCLFMNMDKLVGGDFEKGLANLKAVVETSTPQVRS